MKFPFIKTQVNETTNTNTTIGVNDALLSALLSGNTITRDEALTIPSVASNIDFISSMIASMPIKLYRTKSGKIEELTDDYRVKILNGNTGDIMTAYQIKQAMVNDYFLGKGGYCYISKNKNNVVGLYYVDEKNVSYIKSTDPIKKYATFVIDGKTYKDYEILKLLRNSKDGVVGSSIINQLTKLLETAYQTLLFQLFNVKSGGNKKGFLISDRRLGQEEIDLLKNAWNRMYKTNEQNVIVLNNGLKFQESSNSSVEMQLNESTKTMANEINEIFHIGSTFEDTFKCAIYPIIKNFQDELNDVLLLEKEKRNYFFEFDVKEIIKANIKERYEAYQLAIDNGFKTINEIRQEENLNAIDGLDVLNFGLGSVLYDIKSQTYYTPNTNEVFEKDSQNENNDDGNIEEDDSVKGGVK